MWPVLPPSTGLTTTNNSLTVMASNRLWRRSLAEIKPLPAPRPRGPLHRRQSTDQWITLSVRNTHSPTAFAEGTPLSMVQRDQHRPQCVWQPPEQHHHEGSLTTRGAATFEADLNVAGAATFNGPTTINNNLTVNGNQSPTGDSSISGNQEISGALVVNGATTLNDQFTVAGDTVLQGITRTENDLSGWDQSIVFNVKEDQPGQRSHGWW